VNGWSLGGGVYRLSDSAGRSEWRRERVKDGQRNKEQGEGKGEEVKSSVREKNVLSLVPGKETVGIDCAVSMETINDGRMMDNPVQKKGAAFCSSLI
jgi:hypothetical protein